MNNTNAQTTPNANSPDFQTTIRVKQRDGKGAALFAPANVHPWERVASILIGGILLFWVGRRFVAVVGLTAVAAYLLYRGVSGRCVVYEATAIDTANGAEGVFHSSSTGVGSARRAHTRDKVEEGSWESFPASDPPATSTPVA